MSTSTMNDAAPFGASSFPTTVVLTSDSRWNNNCSKFALSGCLIVTALLILNLLQRLPKKHAKTIQVGMWVVFAVFMMCGVVHQPDVEDPSITITFGAAFQLFSLCLFWLLPRKASQPGATNGTGDSAPFAMIMMVVLSLRLSCTLRFQGYLPTDQSGDGCYQCMEIMTLILSVHGLSRTGLTTKEGLRAAGAITASVLLGFVCYGDLNSRPFADRAYATGIYSEVCAWAFLAYSIIQSGADRTVSSGFLPPALAQACCRAYFWYLASFEMEPVNPKLMMDYFPDAIVAAHFAMCGLIGLATLLVCCPEKDTLVAPLQSSASEPLREVVDDAAGAFEMAKGGVEELAKGLVPVRAVWQNGKMKVEYAKVNGKWTHATFEASKLATE